MGTHTYTVPVYSQEDYDNTFYVNHIDLFARIAIYVSEAVLVYWFIKKIFFLYKSFKDRKELLP